MDLANNKKKTSKPHRQLNLTNYFEELIIVSIHKFDDRSRSNRVTFFPYGYPSKIFVVGEKLQTKSFLQFDLYVCKLAFTEEFRS